MITPSPNFSWLDVVADAQPDLLGAARAAAGRGPTAGDRRVDHRVAVLAEAAAAAPALVRLALRLDELLGDLGEEPARRVVVGRAEQLPAPRVAEVEALARPG